MDKEQRLSIRNAVATLLDENFPQFDYKGCGNNIGVWETPNVVYLEKSYGASYFWGKFRLWVYNPTEYGQEIKIEADIHACGWETMFDGFIKDISDIITIFNFQLGIPKSK